MNLQWRDGDDEDGEEKGGEAELHKNQSCGTDGDIRDDRVGDQLFSSSTGTYSPSSTPSTSSSSFNNVPQPTATHLPLQVPIENEQTVEKGLHKFIMNGETSIYECQDGIFLYTDGYKDNNSRGRRIVSTFHSHAEGMQASNLSLMTTIFFRIFPSTFTLPRPTAKQYPPDPASNR